MIKQLKNRIIELFVSIFLVNADFILMNNEQEKVPVLLRTQNDFSYFWKIKYVEVFIINDKCIEIEFFKEFDVKVDICVRNQYKEIIYSLKTFTVPTLHIIIVTENWKPESYDICIKSGDTFFIAGDFFLENSFDEKSKRNGIIGYMY